MGKWACEATIFYVLFELSSECIIWPYRAGCQSYKPKRISAAFNFQAVKSKKQKVPKYHNPHPPPRQVWTGDFVKYVLFMYFSGLPLHDLMLQQASCWLDIVGAYGKWLWQFSIELLCCDESLSHAICFCFVVVTGALLSSTISKQYYPLVSCSSNWSGTKRRVWHWWNPLPHTLASVLL